MINHDKYFSTVEDTAAFLASVVTCFTCPLGSKEVGNCGRGESCEDTLARWLYERVEDES